MKSTLTKQEILDQIATLLDHPQWDVSVGSTERRSTLAEIAECIGIPTLPQHSKRFIARSIVESWGMDWYPSYESAGETITRQGLSAVLAAVKLATNQFITETCLPVTNNNDHTDDDEVVSRTIQLGQIYRFTDHANSDPDLEFIDGSRNWFFYTDARAKNLRGLRPQAGIWNPQSVRITKKETRIPFIFCTTYPDRAGSFDTPWHDHIDLEEGRVLYFGDNKDPTCIDPSFVRGNSAMLRNQKLQHSMFRTDRELASPVLLVKAHGGNGLNYGFRTPIGLGVIWKSDLVIQELETTKVTFKNYRFEIILLDLSDERDLIDMRWVHLRRQPNISTSEANKHAPAAWTTFINEGISSLPRLQKRNL